MSEAAKRKRSTALGYLTALCGPVLSMPEKQPTAYSYNGVVLPKLPEWDKTVYPYAVICEVVFWGGYYLYFLDRQAAILGMRFPNEFVGVEYRCEKGGTEWEYQRDGEFSSSSDNGYANGMARWSNYDLYFKADLEEYGGTLYLESSEPIPVYE